MSHLPKQGSETEFKILNLLEKEDLGLSILEISEKIGVNRNTTSKYLLSMAERDLIYKIDKGNSKLFYPMRQQKRFADRADYMVRFYQQLHQALFSDWLGDTTKAREIGEQMAIRGAADLYAKQFKDIDFTFENITKLAALAVEITYPIPNVKARVSLGENENCFYLDIENCICDGKKEYKSICEIQVGLLKGVIDRFIAPESVEVEEIECKVDGYDTCKYKITKS
ncbi:MAG: winged helix-turn-helix transcriptional regulator [Promethearchaeota archaeon]|nr:MAG: winged helix-turn-helix transcriptional regulator [Candidatus Lokiarchaeota archaeon]